MRQQAGALLLLLLLVRVCTVDVTSSIQLLLHPSSKQSACPEFACAHPAHLRGRESPGQPAHGRNNSSSMLLDNAHDVPQASSVCVSGGWQRCEQQQQQ
jgi:hypothetical protein